MEKALKCAQKWSKTDPKHAVLLPYSEDENLKFCETKRGELNLVREGKYYHSQEGALREAEEWFARQDLEDVSLLYLYGVGLGYFYEVLKPWLKKKRKRNLVFLECDLAVIYRLFETDRGLEILKNPKVHLYYFEEVNDIPSKLEVLMNHFLKAKIAVGALPLYEKKKNFPEVSLKVVQESVARNALFDEYLRYGVPYYRNFYQNMRRLADSYLGNRFFGKFSGVPAIICGAGPSLEKNAHLLAELGDRALIFAGGSAMNSLNAKGILPHFGAGIDPNAMQYERLVSNTAYEVPYFYRNRMYWKAFNVIRGPRLYITGSGGYELSKYFDEAFGWEEEEEELDEGHNVINFCVEIAARMGCHPIIFVGVDLAFTEMQAYAAGVVEERKVEEEELFSVELFDERPIRRVDIYGKPNYTLWKWVAESEWISKYAKEHPLITFINATEGGLGFPEVQNLRLKEVVERYMRKTHDLLGRVHGETQNGTCPNVTRRRVEELMQQMGESLRRSVEHLNILIEENLAVQEKVKAEQPLTSLQTGLAVLAETELEEEIAYRYILEGFGGISSMLLNYEFRKLKTLPLKKQEGARLKLNERKLRYVKQAAELNLLLLEDALKEQSSFG